MAIAEAWLAARYNRPGHTIIDHYTYCICGDGDLMEGVTQEAASLAGHLRSRQADLPVRSQPHLARGRDESHIHRRCRKRFEAYGWHTRSVPEGNDIEEVAKAIEEAEAESTRPSMILVATHIGYGSPKKQDNFSAHGNPLGEDELQAAKKALGWPTMDKFYLPEDAVNHISPKRSKRALRPAANGRRRSKHTRKPSRERPRNLSKSSPVSFPTIGA